MHLFVEVLTLLFFLGFVAHAVILRGAAGAAFFEAMLLLVALLIPLPFLAIGHALGLQAVKNGLGL